jgi:hypothetical protein
MLRPAAVFAALVAAAATLAACGGDDESESAASTPAPPASDFPSPDGRTLEQVATEEATAEGPVVSPGSSTFRAGENRLTFGVFDPGGEPIPDAQVALYVAKGAKGDAHGPYPAAIESLVPDGAFISRTTSQDPNTPPTFYVSTVDFPGDGEYRVLAMVREGSGYSASLMQSALVGEIGGIPEPGDQAPVVHTPTEDDVADLSEIDTRDPHDSMHEDDLADVIGEKPVVLVMATPALCASRVCGPSVDIAEQVKAEHGDEASFIHMEIYEDNVVDKGLRPQVEAYGLQTEPWIFVIDGEGRIHSEFEGPISVGELDAAVEEVSG